MKARAVLILGLALGLLAVPLAAGAQPEAGRVYRVGLVSIAPDPGAPRTVLWRSFLDGMRELQYIEGRNLAVSTAFAAGRAERLPGLIADLYRGGAEVVVTSGGRETLAAKRANSTIPIVMTLVPDPVAQGLVASLARPGGNITGVTNFVPGFSQKYVELLKAALLSATRFAVVTSPRNPTPENRRELEAAATALGIQLSFVPVHGADDLDAALAQVKRERADGIIITPDPLTYLHRRRLAQAALKHRLPGIYWSREYVEAGGLMSYATSLAALGQRAATYVDKILRGAKPADLPVEQPTTFELVINLKTAKALGVTIPQSLLLRADQVIE